MSRAHRCGLLVLTVLLALAPVRSGVAEHADKDKDLTPAFAKLEHGMTPQQVRQLVGAPQHIARQIFYHRYREQWIYDAPVSVRLTFDCPRGQKLQLLDKTGPRP